MGAERILRISFFGDSICFGQGVSPHLTWVTRVSASLDRLVAEHGGQLVIANTSLNGNTTRQALERMPYDVQSFAPHLVLVQFGMNDCNRWETDRGVPRVSEAGFAANLHEIIDRALTFGAEAVVLNTNHPSARDQVPLAHSDAPYEAGNRRYNELVRQVAAERSDVVRLIDVERAWQERTRGEREALLELVQDDWLHLSLAGHDLYVEIVEPVLTSLVAERLGTLAPAR